MSLESTEGSTSGRRRGVMAVVGGNSRSGPDPDRRIPTLFPGAGRATMTALFHGLDGVPASAVESRAWDDELAEILHQRLAGFALAAALDSGTELHTDTESRLREAHLASIVTALRVESTALAVLGALEDRGIPFVITKGVGIADAYPQPSLRPYGDVDVLVPPGLFGSAMRTLHALGFEEYFESGEPRPYFDRHCREGVNLVRPDGASIDLHHHVPPWVWGERLRFSELRAASWEVEVAGGALPVVHPIHNLIVAALHVVSDRRAEPGHKLVTWRDVVTLARACDPDDVVREARRVRLDWYLAFILRQLPAYVRPEPLVERLGRPDARPADRFRLRRLVPPGIGSKHQIAQAFRLPVPNAAAFLAGYVVPSQAFLRLRYGDPWAYRRWWEEAFGRLRGANSRDPRRGRPWT